MKWRNLAFGAAAVLMMAAVSVHTGRTAAVGKTATINEANPPVEERLRQLEDGEEIRQLLDDYGSTLDKRDFAGFARLFAENAEYGGGGGTGVTKGPAAIGKLLEDTFRKNPTGVGSPNFHVFTNQIIHVNGGQADSMSKGAFVVRGKDDKPEIAILATNSDVLTRENGRWKFKRRMMRGDIPFPPASK